MTLSLGGISTLNQIRFFSAIYTAALRFLSLFNLSNIAIKCIFKPFLYKFISSLEIAAKSCDKNLGGCIHFIRLNFDAQGHGLRTPNEGIKQRNLKFWADVADKICFGRTYKFGIGILF